MATGEEQFVQLEAGIVAPEAQSAVPKGIAAETTLDRAMAPPEAKGRPEPI